MAARCARNRSRCAARSPAGNRRNRHSTPHADSADAKVRSYPAGPVLAANAAASGACHPAAGSPVNRNTRRRPSSPVKATSGPPRAALAQAADSPRRAAVSSAPARSWPRGPPWSPRRIHEEPSVVPVRGDQLHPGPHLQFLQHMYFSVVSAERWPSRRRTQSSGSPKTRWYWPRCPGVMPASSAMWPRCNCSRVTTANVWLLPALAVFGGIRVAIGLRCGEADPFHKFRNKRQRGGGSPTAQAAGPLARRWRLLRHRN